LKNRKTPRVNATRLADMTVAFLILLSLDFLVALKVLTP